MKYSLPRFLRLRRPPTEDEQRKAAWVEEPAKETTVTKACYDCGTELVVPFKFCVPATLEEQKRMADGEYVQRPPLCYDCWVKRTGRGQ